MSRSPSEMSFVDFAESMQPSGAVNRFPVIGAGPDVFSYSVYMNGPSASGIPAHFQEQTFKDVMLHALTEKLQLNSASARDNLKVAEMVALRGAWMSSVLESSTEHPLSAEAIKDYELLSEGLTHPWIVEQLDAQRALMSKLQPALLQTNIQHDIVPKETSVGKVVGQDQDFTFQKTTDGEVVTHENRRLDDLPAVGTEVSVSYYRGHGQVVNSLENLKVSPPFLDPLSNDFAVMLEDGKGLEQVVLFNSLAGFEKFVKLHGMDRDMVRQAMDLREASPKELPKPPQRQVVKEPYVDAVSGCLAVDYKENAVVYSALFRDAKELSQLASEFGLGREAVQLGASFEDARMSNTPTPDVDHRKTKESEDVLLDRLKSKGYETFKPSGVEGQVYMGKVVDSSRFHVAQDVGRRVIVVHDVRALDKLVAKDDSMSVKFVNGRGHVNEMVKSSRDLGR